MDHKTLECPTTTHDQIKDQDYDLIDFYLQPEFLKMFSQQLAGQPKIDLTKVAQLKRAIANKSFRIDELELADKIIKFESEFFKDK